MRWWLLACFCRLCRGEDGYAGEYEIAVAYEEFPGFADREEPEIGEISKRVAGAGFAVVSDEEKQV